MEWGAKWDWGSIAKLSSKACESPKKLQLTDWGIVEEEGETDMGQGSTNSSPEGTAGAKVSKMENCKASVEACIGLKLGKRTYFENTGGGGNGGKTKKPSSCQGGATFAPRCQVEGCNVDLSSGKEYHRKHRVCESHSKHPKVIVGGLERRFCQQCSRFHSLSEFDEKKRSCRRRLCDHNARRRKPHHQSASFQLNSSSSNSLSPSFYDGRQQINFLMNNNAPIFGTSQTPSNSTCLDNSISSGIHPPNVTVGFRDCFSSNDALLDSKGPIGQGVRGSNPMLYMETNMTDEFPRALSLLSTSSWSSSCEQQPQQQQDCSSISQPPVLPGLPEYWSCVEPAGPVDAHLDGDFYLHPFN